MDKYSDFYDETSILRDKIVGLGEHSIRKNYYPELQRRISELELSESRIKALIKAVPDMLVLLDENGTIIEYSPGRDVELQLEGKSAIGANIKTVKPSWISEIFSDNAKEIFQKSAIKEFEHDFDQNMIRRYCEIRTAECGRNEVLFMVRDITERKELENKLIYMGTKDFLTDLYNRSYFEQVQREITAKSKRNLGLVICDVDGLKLINDTLGHSAGDFALRKAAEIIKRCFPSNAVVARIGGDEFGVLLFECTAKTLEENCNMINSKVDQYNKLNSGIYLSISTGFAVTEPLHSEEFEKLFAKADNDMYMKKLLRSSSTKNAIVKTLMKAMEARDYITEGHAERLGKIVLIMAKKLGLSESSTNELRLLAQFHDLGKVGIPDNILQKPGKLNCEEKNIMQMHSLIGQRIANVSAELAHIAELILKHHERWDGTGYPLGIEGKNIPLECRILALADAYDAMTNNRPYRKAMSKSEAVKEIIKCSRTQFDPKLVPLFVELIENGELVLE